MKTGTFGLRTVQLAPRTGMENVFVIAARLSPILLGMVIGLMFSRPARLIEWHGTPPDSSDWP